MQYNTFYLFSEMRFSELFYIDVKRKWKIFEMPNYIDIKNTWWMTYKTLKLYKQNIISMFREVGIFLALWISSKAILFTL